MNQVEFSAAQKRVGKRLVVLTSAVSLSASLLTVAGAQQAAYADESASISQGGITSITEKTTVDPVGKVKDSLPNGTTPLPEVPLNTPGKSMDNSLDNGGHTEIISRFDAMKDSGKKTPEKDAEEFTTSFKLKNAVYGGGDEAWNKEHTFKWQCGENGAKKEGTVKLKGDEEKEITGLSEGVSCLVKHETADTKQKDFEYNLNWDLIAVDGDHSSGENRADEFRPGDGVVLTAQHLYVKPGQKEKLSGFRVKKLVSTDHDAANKLHGKMYSFDWQCQDGDNKYKGSFKLLDQKEIEIPHISPTAVCSVVEKDAPKIDGYVSSVNWSVSTIKGEEEKEEKKEGPKVADEFLIGEKDKPLTTVIATNTYTKGSKPVPPTKDPKPNPGNGSSFGSSALGILGIILAAITAGGLGYLFTMFKHHFRW
ncbi:putative secreted LPxTG protein [Corynebacterium kutscheri]|uniref:Secreted LPxTG protein n=1 Tax=Corynebacterium kutscheri TaxID=35755 RepID=A0A0F6R1P2_9CORY|nr:DUF5979 domain-containing protein [Corynebacterium kutscheri]AKE41985.1 hypothetical protein UL82_09225 [Corynebacterium kutscheri]VEH06220.1 putative secreted LPxTG protein [Corynebacterium kutscheri]VEH10326.1 putative secreted LPxTG protein [Corynebacterium kutscheri]VEH82136.1 putative secreted LPxTG protein [Corynebacterium kutscheri]